VSTKAATEVDCLASIFAAVDGDGQAPKGFPSLDQALARLAEIRAHEDLAAARRVALDGLVRVDPDYGPGGPKADLVDRALARVGPVRDMDANVTATLFRRRVAPGNVDFVTNVQMELPIKGRSLDDVEPVLNPVNWFRCYKKWWTGMRSMDPGRSQRHYREEVAGWSPTLKVDVCLQFLRRQRPGAHGPMHTLEFEKCPVEDHQPDDCRVSFDTGFLMAEQRPSGVLLTTSKSIQFAGPFDDGVSLAVSAPSLGYREIAEELVHACISCKDARTWDAEEDGHA
jgi:hypothetical protein